MEYKLAYNLNFVAINGFFNPLDRLHVYSAKCVKEKQQGKENVTEKNQASNKADAENAEEERMPPSQPTEDAVSPQAAAKG